MRNRIRFIGLGLCYLLAGCGKSASPNGPGATGLQPVMGKLLRLTNSSAFDSSGALIHVFCGDAGNPCESDEVVFTAGGEYIVRECNECPLEDPKNPRAIWTLDEARNEITILYDDPEPDVTFKIVAVSDNSITLDIPTEILLNTLFRGASISGSPSVSPEAKGTSTHMTWAGG